MLTRENIREKLLDIPHQQTRSICGSTVELRKDGTYDILLGNETVIERQTIQGATSALFASQKAPDTNAAPKAQPAKA
jgi:hypothetical protein